MAVAQDGCALEFASTALKRDKEVALVAVSLWTSQRGIALFFASEELKNDKEVVLAAVSQRGYTLTYASEELKKDKEVVLAAVEQDGKALEFASEELKNDKEVVLEAVEQDGWALMHASAELKCDKEVVLTAIAQNMTVLSFARQNFSEGRLSEIVPQSVRAQNSFMYFLLAATPLLPTNLPGAADPSSSSQRIRIYLDALAGETCALHRINALGDDAWFAVKHLIAAFVGAPCGAAWQIMRAASQNMERYVELLKEEDFDEEDVDVEDDNRGWDSSDY